VSAILVSLIAIAGTLLGSLTTYLFQRRTALHAEATARVERLRQDSESHVEISSPPSPT
jgi:membrane protein YqaA with SNARE-associated domain